MSSTEQRHSDFQTTSLMEATEWTQRQTELLQEWFDQSAKTQSAMMELMRLTAQLFLIPAFRLPQQFAQRTIGNGNDGFAAASIGIQDTDEDNTSDS
jgi:hypothetical protein